MCGIAGFWTCPSSGPDGLNASQRSVVLEAMATAIRHRGPDEYGYWQDETTGIGLAHRRLSILDLSPAGAQPMQSASGRFVIIYNGEIYNHLELRTQLEQDGFPIAWRGHSDTETLLAAIESWGIRKALQSAFGMFAFALWDRKEKTLILARDRTGEKPLYYGILEGGGLVFASELHSIRQHPGFQAKIDSEAAGMFLRYSFIPAPRSIYQNIFKLLPGQYARYTSPSTEPILQSYWSLQDIIAETASDRQREISLAECASGIENILRSVVSSQMISDVPIGAFLSGGIDSSLIVSLMQECSPQNIRTFSIGFSDARFDESRHAKMVAQHLGTDHTELILDENDILDIVPSIPNVFDEPFADPSLLPTVLLSKMTHEHVTVALSGDGGDEIFAGYNRHIIGPRMWKKIQGTPRFGRRAVAAASRAVESVIAKTPASSSAVLKLLKLPHTTPDKLARFGKVFADSDSLVDMYELLLSTGPQFQGGMQVKQLKDSLTRSTRDLDLSTAEHLMAWDLQLYLSGDILVKVDRAAMSSSLETRAPFLDSRAITAAWSVPMEHKIGKFGGKTVLKEILYRHVPRDLIDRPKQGFAIPLNEWLRGGLREWAENAICAYRNREELLSFADLVESLWANHQARLGQHGNVLLNAVVLSEWVSAQRNVGRVSL